MRRVKIYYCFCLEFWLNGLNDFYDLWTSGLSVFMLTRIFGAEKREKELGADEDFLFRYTAFAFRKTNKENRLRLILELWLSGLNEFHDLRTTGLLVFRLTRFWRRAKLRLSLFAFRILKTINEYRLRLYFDLWLSVLNDLNNLQTKGLLVFRLTRIWRPVGAKY